MIRFLTTGGVLKYGFISLINQKTGKEKENLRKFYDEYSEKKKDRGYYGKDIDAQNFVYPERRKDFLEKYMGEIHTLKKLMDESRKT